MIRVPAVRVVDEDGAQLGVLPTHEALRLAQERGYDLVEVAPMAVPPVARLLDYGQYKYEAAKKEKEARRHQRSVDFKEIRLKPKIGQGDFDTKVRRAIQFLEDGDRVKVACQFRGRELTHANLGRDLLSKFAEQVKEHGSVERQPLLEGKSMSIVIASTHKPKPQAGQAPEPRTGAPTTEPAQPEPAAPAPAVGEPAGTDGAATPATATATITRSTTGRAPSARTSTTRPAVADRPAEGTGPGSAGE